MAGKGKPAPPAPANRIAQGSSALCNPAGRAFSARFGSAKPVLEPYSQQQMKENRHGP